MREIVTKSSKREHRETERVTFVVFTICCVQLFVCCHGTVISEFGCKSFSSVSLEVLNLEHRWENQMNWNCQSSKPELRSREETWTKDKNCDKDELDQDWGVVVSLSKATKWFLGHCPRSHHERNVRHQAGWMELKIDWTATMPITITIRIIWMWLKIDWTNATLSGSDDSFQVPGRYLLLTMAVA